MNYADREPFVTDHRLQMVETLVRLKYPALPDDALFATARVEEEGRAHFIVTSPVAGVPDPYRMVITRKVPFAKFAEYEKATGHFVSGGATDPVLWIFEHMTETILPKLRSAAEMNHPEDST